MGKISISGIRVYAYHGCLAEETKIGSDYEVNVTVDTELKPSAKTDNLDLTIDYVSINAIVKEEMIQPSKLLENVVFRIIEKIILKHTNINEIEVSVAKKNPPISGDVREVVVKEKQIKGVDF